jgi:hypothetical protein
LRAVAKGADIPSISTLAALELKPILPDVCREFKRRLDEAPAAAASDVLGQVVRATRRQLKASKGSRALDLPSITLRRPELIGSNAAVELRRAIELILAMSNDRETVSLLVDHPVINSRDLDAAAQRLQSLSNQLKFAMRRHPQSEAATAG